MSITTEDDEHDLYSCEMVNYLAGCLAVLKHQTDCLGIVMQFLSAFECVTQCALVCKEWKEMIQQMQCRISFRSNYYYHSKGRFVRYHKFYKSEFFRNVKELVMDGNDSGIFKKIINCKKNHQLEKLQVNVCGPKAAFFIATSENVCGLTSLKFDNCRILDIGAIRIVESDKLSNLKKLSLPRCRVSSQFASRLSSSPHMVNLTSLDLQGNNLKVGGVQHLANSPNLSHLTKLNLTRNRIGKEGAIYLATSQFLTQLTNLNLDGNNIEDEGLSSICSSTNLTLLKKLDLSGNSLSDEGIKELAMSANMTNLKALILLNNRGNINFRVRAIQNHYTASSVAVIAQSPFLKQLDKLSLLDECLDAEGARLLSEAIPGLSYLRDDFESDEED